MQRILAPAAAWPTQPRAPGAQSRESWLNRGWTVGAQPRLLAVKDGSIFRYFYFLYCWTPQAAAWDEVVGDEWSQLRKSAEISCSSLIRRMQLWGAVSISTKTHPILELVAVSHPPRIKIKKAAGNSSFSCLFSHRSNPWSCSLTLPGDAPDAVGGGGDVLQSLNQLIYLFYSDTNTPSSLKKRLYLSAAFSSPRQMQPSL